MNSGMTGLDKVLATLNTLADKSAKKMAKAGVNAGLAVIAKSIRQQINAAPVSGELKAAARKLISKRLKKKEGQEYVGKAGFAVGKSGKKKKESAHARYMRGQGGSHETRGVGISESDIHWFVLGTVERTTSAGHDTGQIAALLVGAIQKAIEGASDEVLEAMRKKVEQVLASETAKAKKG